MKKLIIISVSLIFMQLQLFSQQTEVLIDEVVAVVGNRIILESDLETQLLQHQTKGLTSGKKTMKCEILEDLMIQKLFMNQAEADSIEITDNQIENALNQRIRYFTSQFGSQEKLENFYGKSILEIKNEFRDLIKEQMMAEEDRKSVV